MTVLSSGLSSGTPCWGEIGQFPLLLPFIFKSHVSRKQFSVLKTYCLVVDAIVDSKDDNEEKTREVADTMIYQFSWKFLQLGCDMQW